VFEKLFYLKDYFPLCSKKMKYLKNINMFHESFMNNGQLQV